jgi:hypothetical protein
MKPFFRIRPGTVAATFAVAALVSACGGDDFRERDATSEVPPSASESSDGFIAYLRRLVASAADTLEPVDTGMVTAPKDDTSEPQTVP